MEKYEAFKNDLLKEYKKGNIMFMSIEGIQICSVKEFIKQPADGILYDLNKGEEVVLTYIEDKKWVNDFAVAKTIRELKNKIKELEDINKQELKK